MTVKRSSKKYRNQKKKDQKKKLLATGMMVCLGTFPVWSNDNVLLTIIPGMSKAFGSNLGIDYDYGVGAKLTYRKGDNLDFFLEADYKRLSLPNVSPIDLVNVNAGAGYHFNFNERFGDFYFSNIVTIFYFGMISREFIINIHESKSH